MASGSRKAAGGISGAISGATAGSALGPYGAVAGGLAGLLGGILGAGGDSPSPEQIAAEEYRQQLEQLGMPPEEAYKIALQKFQYLGDIAPELEQIAQVQDSELQGISTDPELRRQQLAAIAQAETEAQTGLTGTDRSDINKIERGLGQQLRSARESALQRLASRGTLDSGLALASELEGQQAAAQQSADLGAEIAKQAMARRTAAAERLLSGASNVRTQDFNEAAQKAQAQDAINKFRSSQSQGVYGANTNRINTARESNRSAAQDIANRNVGITNQQQISNADLIRQRNQDQANRIRDIYGAASGAAKAGREEEQRKDASYANILKGVGDLANTALPLIKKAKDPESKEDPNDRK